MFIKGDLIIIQIALTFFEKKFKPETGTRLLIKQVSNKCKEEIDKLIETEIEAHQN